MSVVIWVKGLGVFRWPTRQLPRHTESFRSGENGEPRYAEKTDLSRLAGAGRTFIAVLDASTLQPAAARPREGQTETIVMVRHGEKTAQELGQLSCKGLNRALALPDVLTGLYGKPDFIYAPNPSVQVYDRNHSSFSYVRPLITIEPTAIRLGMSVNTQIGFNDIEKLQQELMQPAFADALIFVAWEHNYLYRFARQMLRSNGKDPSVVLEWPSGDYDTIYVLRIRRSYGMPQVSFTTAKEMLDDAVSDSCPTVR